ncbi:PCNA-interacting partner-like isoform X2 [Tachypleus tridentatus]|uniref:PCNA-interacting partner-like isoform X2 n=1 Tax=Tachypleus tridentatus TaxID=6853 RepID=UPI003FD61BCF
MVYKIFWRTLSAQFQHGYCLCGQWKSTLRFSDFCVISCGSCGNSIETVEFESNYHSNISLVRFCVHLCRQYNLFENGHTTFLSEKDHLLALQLSIAGLNKKDKGEYGVMASEVIFAHNSYVKLYCEDGEGAVVDKTLQAYMDFLKLGNLIDLWKMSNILEKSMVGNQDLAHFVKKCSFLLCGRPNNKPEACSFSFYYHPVYIYDVFYLSFELLCLVKDFTGTGYSRCSVRNLVNLLCKDKDIYHVILETPLDTSLQDGSVLNDEKVGIMVELIEEECLSSVLFNGFSSVSNQGLPSAHEEYVEQVMTAFIRLLVNSRDELALVMAITSPLVGLSHTAFTHLKHRSIETGMPMCQTALSYVLKLRLGGKSYAPSLNCSLRPYSKGLGIFVDVLNSLQTIMEEDFSTESAVRRILNVLKNKLSKLAVPDINANSIETVSKKLLVLTADFLRKQRNSLLSLEQGIGTTTMLGQMTFIVLRELIDCVNTSTIHLDPMTIFSGSDQQRTPLTVPSVFAYFRSPEDLAESTEDVKPLRIRQTEKSQLKKFVVKQFPFSEPKGAEKSTNVLGHCEKKDITLPFQADSPEREMLSSEVETSTSDVIVLSKDENFCVSRQEGGKENKLLSKQSRIAAKRLFLKDITNEPLSKVSKKNVLSNESNSKTSIYKKNSAPKKVRNKVPKLAKGGEIRGQGKITKFFQVT